MKQPSTFQNESDFVCAQTDRQNIMRLIGISNGLNGSF